MLSCWAAVEGYRRDHGVSEGMVDIDGKGVLWRKTLATDNQGGGEMMWREKQLATDETLIKHGSDINSERSPANLDAVLNIRDYAFKERGRGQDDPQMTRRDAD